MASYDWQNWLHDLLAAVIGGGSTAAYGVFTVIVLDPTDFNPQTGKLYYAAAMMFGFGALSHLFMFLKQRPVPGEVVSEKKQESIQYITGTGDGTGTQKVTTKHEEKVEVLPPPQEKP